MKLHINNCETLVKDFVLKRAKSFVVFLLFIFSISLYAESSEKKDDILNHADVQVIDQKNNSAENSSISNESKAVIYIYGDATVYDSLESHHYKLVNVERKNHKITKQKKALVNSTAPKKEATLKIYYSVKYFFNGFDKNFVIISSKDKNIAYCSGNRGQNFSKNVDYYNYQFIKNEDFSTQQDYNYNNPFVKNNHFLGKHSVRPPTSII